MDTAHRKIELQSPADLNYLRANATRAAHAKLDLHFPPSAAPESGDDAMKMRVQELVDQYIASTFAAAQPNLSINGLEDTALTAALARSASTNEELEPYDTKLAARLRSVAAQIEALTLSLAKLRRQAPAQAASAWLEREGREREMAERAREVGEEDALRRIREGEVGGTGAEGVVRWDEMGEVWGAGLRDLRDVSERVGSTVAKVERAGRVVSILDGKSS